MQIYLDYNASTPIAPEVREAMLPYLDGPHGNPSSRHFASAGAKKILEESREKVAALIGAKHEEVVFTSGGSESNNTAIKGVFWASGKRHIATSVIEHPATLNACRFLERQGARLTLLEVDQHGLIDPSSLSAAISEETALVTLMHANNEVGTIQRIPEAADVAKRFGVPLHVDAAQSIGKVRVDVDDLGADLLSIAGHKLYAPKGVGALYVRAGTKLEPLIHGGGHEHGLRAGTESILLAAALGKAAELAAEHLEDADRIRSLRDRLFDGLVARFGKEIRLNGHPEARLPNTVNVCFIGRIGADILDAIPEVAASTGSACHEGAVELSAVLRALGVTENEGKGAIRFSLGRWTTADEVDRVLGLLGERLAQARVSG